MDPLLHHHSIIIQSFHPISPIPSLAMRALSFLRTATSSPREISSSVSPSKASNAKNLQRPPSTRNQQHQLEQPSLDRLIHQWNDIKVVSYNWMVSNQPTYASERDDIMTLIETIIQPGHPYRIRYHTHTSTL